MSLTAADLTEKLLLVCCRKGSACDKLNQKRFVRKVNEHHSRLVDLFPEQAAFLHNLFVAIRTCQFVCRASGKEFEQQHVYNFASVSGQHVASIAVVQSAEPSQHGHLDGEQGGFFLAKSKRKTASHSC